VSVKRPATAERGVKCGVVRRCALRSRLYVYSLSQTPAGWYIISSPLDRFPTVMQIARRIVLPLVVAFCLYSAAAAVEKAGARAHVENSSYRAALESIRADRLGRNVEQLADEAMEGREAGTRGGLAAAQYLADQYTRLRFRGAGTDGGFLQPFPPNYRNVLAIVEGSDPKLREEVIVVGAHYDHIGYGGFAALGSYGYVYPGADDNASGTAAVLALAEAFSRLAAPPRRTVLLAHWDAEEKGLFGSRHWVASPTVSLDRVVAMVNVDMIGRLRDEKLTVVGTRSGTGWRRLVSLTNGDAPLRIEFPWAISAKADDYPFFDREIPVLMFHTGLHGDYHRPSDLAGRINREGIEQVARLIFGVVYELADRPAVAPPFRASARQETAEMEHDATDRTARPPDRLGVGWIEGVASAGGVRVSMVAAGSPADRAGVRVGDLIVRVNDREIRDDDDFLGAISTADPSATLDVRRAGETKLSHLAVRLAEEPLRWGILWRLDDAEPGTVVLTHIVPGSPAARAGLQSGDRVYRVGGRDFADETEFLRLVKDPKNPVAPLSLLIERDGRLRSAVLSPHRAEPVRRAA
jgi:S1-C subfamily serine protease